MNFMTVFWNSLLGHLLPKNKRNWRTHVQVQKGISIGFLNYGLG